MEKQELTAVLKLIENGIIELRRVNVNGHKFVYTYNPVAEIRDVCYDNFGMYYRQVSSAEQGAEMMLQIVREKEEDTTAEELAENIKPQLKTDESIQGIMNHLSDVEKRTGMLRHVYHASNRAMPDFTPEQIAKKAAEVAILVSQLFEN